MRVVYFAFAAAIAAAAVAPAQALFVGGSLHTDYLFPDQGSPYQDFGNVAVTGPNTLLASGLGSVSDINLSASDTKLTVNFGNSVSWSNANFNGFVVFDDTNSIGAITSVSIGGDTTASFDMSRISFDSDHIYINWQGLTFNQGEVLSLNVNGAVPEPASWALMLGGFGAIGGALRSRKKAAVSFA